MGKFVSLLQLCLLLSSSLVVTSMAESNKSRMGVGILTMDTEQRPTMTIDEIAEKMFYEPDEEPWDLVDYEKQLEEIEKYEKWIEGLKFVGELPLPTEAFAGLAGFMSLVGSLTSDKSGAYWHKITAEIDKTVLNEKLSTMKAKIDSFQSSYEHVHHEGRDFIISGFRLIDDIFAHFAEPSSILKKYPLHSSPVLLGFVPIAVLYVQYAAQRFPNDEADWRSKIYNKAMWNLEVFKELCITERMKAATSTRWYDVYYNSHVHPFDTEGTWPLTFPKPLLPGVGSHFHPYENDFQPNYIRCTSVGSKDCRGKALEFWNRSDYAKQCWEKHRYECIVDRFSDQVVLAESAYDGNLSGDFIGHYENDWNEERRMNCLQDYIRAIEYLYQTAFWRVGSLMF